MLNVIHTTEMVEEEGSLWKHLKVISALIAEIAKFTVLQHRALCLQLELGVHLMLQAKEVLSLEVAKQVSQGTWRIGRVADSRNKMPTMHMCFCV